VANAVAQLESAVGGGAGAPKSYYSVDGRHPDYWRKWLLGSQGAALDGPNPLTARAQGLRARIPHASNSCAPPRLRRRVDRAIGLPGTKQSQSHRRDDRVGKLAGYRTTGDYLCSKAATNAPSVALNKLHSPIRLGRPCTALRSFTSTTRTQLQPIDRTGIKPLLNRDIASPGRTPPDGQPFRTNANAHKDVTRLVCYPRGIHIMPNGSLAKHPLSGWLTSEIPAAE